jgi:hypothetical protein
MAQVTGTTDSTGTATLTLDLSQGTTWTVAVTAPPGYQTPTAQTIGPLSNGQTVAVKFQLAAATATATVVVDTASGAPVAGVAVTATSG